MELIPGHTQTFGDPCSSGCPEAGPLSGLRPVIDRKIILLSTATITEENLYANGLFQNVFVFYRMFEAMGYAPILIVNEKPKNLKQIPEPLRKCRTIVMDEILRSPMPNVLALLEIGMSMDPLVRQFIKMLGGRLIKIYLGNILNIDIETPIFIPKHFFNHHVVGRSDQILVSPHYGQHAEYASCINHVAPPKDLTTMVAPYVWDPNILTRDGTQSFQWRAPATSEEEIFVVMEPNISFQKCAIVPLLSLEHWYRTIGKPAGWKGSVKLINGHRLELVPHFMGNIMPALEIIKDGRVEFIERQDIVTTMREWPTATFLLHNVNNEYNYMTLEVLWAGFPVIHNSPTWRDFGYYYEGADLNGAVKQIQEIRLRHSERREAYKAHATLLAWRYSPYNPEIQAAWRKLLENPEKE